MFTFLSSFVASTHFLQLTSTTDDLEIKPDLISPSYLVLTYDLEEQGYKQCLLLCFIYHVKKSNANKMVTTIYRLDHKGKASDKENMPE